MYLHVKQLLPHRKEPRGWLVCEGLRSLALTSKLLRLLVRRKATKGAALNTLAQRTDEDRMLKCL